MRWIAGVALLLLAASPATGEESASAGAAKSLRRLCVKTFELHQTEPRPLLLPGVSVALLPERATAASSAAAFPECAASDGPCMRGDLATGGHGEACFDGVAAGRYFVRTRLGNSSGEVTWETNTGPIDVPVADFERLELSVGLDYTWAERSEASIGHQPGWAEDQRTRPIAGPLLRWGSGSKRSRTICVVAWSTTYMEELPEAWIVLEAIAETTAGSATPAPEGATRSRFSGASDERGAACFEGVPPGRYVAHASIDGFWASEVGPFEVPGWDFDRADLRVGLDISWPVDLLVVSESFPAVEPVLPPGERVCAQVVDARSSAPIPGSTLLLQTLEPNGIAGDPGAWLPSGDPPSEGEADSHGDACFERVQPGTYSISASREGYWDTRVGRIVIPSDPPVKLMMRLGLVPRGVAPRSKTATRRLCVELRDSDRAPLPGIRVKLRPATGGSADSDEAWQPCLGGKDRCGPFESVSDIGGRTCFEELPPGAYRVEAELEGWWSAEVGPVALPSGASGILDLPLMLDAVQLDGIIVTSH